MNDDIYEDLQKTFREFESRKQYGEVIISFRDGKPMFYDVKIRKLIIKGCKDAKNTSTNK